MLVWEKLTTRTNDDGSKVVRYAAKEGRTLTEIRIESRRRPIPHANRDGSWMYTSYFLMIPGEEELEFHSLKDAKKAAEERIKKIPGWYDGQVNKNV